MKVNSRITPKKLVKMLEEMGTKKKKNVFTVKYIISTYLKRLLSKDEATYVLT